MFRNSDALDRSKLLAGWGRNPELSELETLMWRTDRAPENSWSGVLVFELDSTPDWDRFVRAAERGIELVPRFSERVADNPLQFGRATWEPDPHFDLGYHLRRARLPGPGTRRQLLDLAQNAGVQPLDRQRPPWTSVLVEGLEGGRSAWVIQIHHVIADGAAATQLIEAMLTPGGAASVELPGQEAERSPNLFDRLVEIPRRTVKVATDPIGTLRYGASLARVASPPPASRSELMRRGTRRSWRFQTFECELAELRAAGKAVGGTVNDAYVCAVLGGLRAYHDQHGEDLDDVPMSMPVSVRRSEDDPGGNRFTGAYFSAPASIADPRERMEALRKRVSGVRGEPALDFVNSVMPALNRAPAALSTAAMTSLNQSAVLTSSSWPGVKEQPYVGGARFERMYVFGPLPGTRLTAAMNSHVGICCIGVNADRDAFADLDMLWACIQDGLDQILALAR